MSQLAHSSTHFWWRNHIDRRYFTVLRYEPNSHASLAVMDDFGNLVNIP